MRTPSMLSRPGLAMFSKRMPRAAKTDSSRLVAQEGNYNYCDALWKWWAVSSISTKTTIVVDILCDPSFFAPVSILNDRWYLRHFCSSKRGFSAFGELALLYASPRAATVVASSDCLLWVMERDVYKLIYSSFIRQQVQEKWDLLGKVPALQHLGHDEKVSLVNALELVRPRLISFLLSSYMHKSYDLYYDSI